MSVNEQIKMLRIVLNQLANDILLNNIFKLVSMFSKEILINLKGKLSRGNLSISSLDQILENQFVGLHVAAKINSSEFLKLILCTKS